MGKNATIVALGRKNVDEAIGTNFGAKRYPQLADRLHGWAGPRPVLENNPAFLQPISYVIVRARLNGEDRFMTYKRGTQGSEDRLHQKLSIGIGGHVDAEHAVYFGDGSMDVTASVYAAAYREIQEEIGVDQEHLGALVFNQLGFVQTDSDAAGRVHLGFVFQWHADEFLKAGGQFRFEPGIEKPEFLSRSRLFAPETPLEEWSRLALKLI